MLDTKLPAIRDIEEDSIPSAIPELIDGHVHIFPDRLFAAVRSWFDEHGWPIRYRQSAQSGLQFLIDHGVSHIVALQYAHKPGLAAELNAFGLEIQNQFAGRVTSLATVFPGEEGAEDILRAAFASGLRGVKLHQHVQCFALDGPAMEVVYKCCAAHNRPLLIHAGREPKSDAYPCDPHQFCKVELIEDVLRAFPELQLCVPHLGADEFSEYQKLIEKYDNLWLDTTMAITDYLPKISRSPLSEYRSDRVLYGSDFPNLPYAWDREAKQLLQENLTKHSLRAISSENARVLYGIG